MVVKKRIPTSLKVDPELWSEVKIMAIRVHKNITEYFEDALRERLVKDYEIVAAERKRKEQERIQQEQLDQRYQQIINTDPGVDVEPKIIAREVEEQPHQEYKRNIHHYKPENSTDKNRTQQQQQSQSKQQTPLLKSLGKGIVPSLREGEKESRLWMPGLKFPMTREKLMQFAKKQDQNPAYKDIPEILPIMEELPNGKKEYKDVSQLEEDVKKIYNANRGKIIEVLEYNEDGSQTHATFDLTKVVECEIIVDKDINKYRNILSLSS